MYPGRGFLVRKERSECYNYKNMANLTQYFKDTRSELKHVSWPTRGQAIAYTLVVVVISLATAVYLGLLDIAFTDLIERFVI